MKLHIYHTAGITGIPNGFLDHYMPTATGDYVKVYLYLLRMIQGGTGDLSVSTISDSLHYTEGDVIRALRYWEKEHLLALNWQDERHISDLILLPVPDAQTSSDTPTSNFSETAAIGKPAPTVPKKESEPTYEKKKADDTFAPKEYSPAQLSNFKKEMAYDTMLTVLEGYFGRPLNLRDIQTATFIYKELHFSVDLIYHLYEYCVERGKYRPEYIQRVAISWKEQNIQTPEQAENASLAYNADYTCVCQAFGLHRMPGKVEQQFIDRWVKEWGFDSAIISEACSRTLLKIQKPDFHYANSILERWRKANVHTKKDIENLDARYKNQKSNTTSKPNSTNKFNQFPQRNYSKEDFAELEKKLLEKSRQS